MVRVLLSVLCFVFLACDVLGDMYLQNPRGSNDRLNEQGDRNNANRLFDSENNARGGYCWGPTMSFVEGSILPVEWTAQHGCGGPHVTCTEIIQYMCSDTSGPDTDIIRDGTTTNTIPDDPTQYNAKSAAGNGFNAGFTFGMNENYQYYQDCKARERNKGLFIADQILGGKAINTRQNPGGTRYGFECTEERDYYPYWHPSPWKDVAVLTDKIEHCDLYQKQSQNVVAKNYCKGATVTGNTAYPNNEQACTSSGGTWASEPAFGIPPPECRLAVFSRDNHLGNTEGSTSTANYTWVLPKADVEPCVATSTCNCTLRVRYNITTNESSGITDNFIDSRNNSVIKNNPTLNVEGGELTLALNTAQYGRTFQDRSYVFHIIPRPQGVSADTKIYNLNVRGKRGNIVQTFPATEYDFVPNRLEVVQDDIVHFQWTGCDNNPAGNQGEGRAQTDRSNIVQIKDLDSNIPVAATNTTVDKLLFDSNVLRTRMALIDQNQASCLTVAQLKAINADTQQDVRNCAKLNAQPTPYFDGGLVRMNQTGKFTYMSTRNNNFSNRTQKGQLTVAAKPAGASVGVIVGSVFGAIAAVGAASFAGLFYYGKKNPLGRVGRMVDRLPSLPSFSSGSTSGARRVPLMSADHGAN